jgi:hypothetical protein
VFLRILDCCHYSIHKNDKFISHTPAMADFAVWPKEVDTIYRLSQNCQARADRDNVTTVGRGFAADLLQVQPCGNHEYDFELHSDETAKARRVLVDSLQKQEGLQAVRRAISQTPHTPQPRSAGDCRVMRKYAKLRSGSHP